MWLVEVVNANKQLSVSEKFCFKYRISMIKAKLSFFWTSNSEGHGSHGNKSAILILGSVNFPMSVISTKLYFVKIGWVHQKLYIFKCTMLKTLNSDFLDWEDTLSELFYCLCSKQSCEILTTFQLINRCNDLTLFKVGVVCLIIHKLS